MDEKLHQYYVHGEPYSLSVSGWWKLFFEEFDAQRMSERIVQRHLATPGFRASASGTSLLGEVPESILASSIYNFAQHIRVFQRHGDNDFLDALRAVTLAAKDDYACRCACFPFSVERVIELGRHFLMDPQKPQGPSCYYLMLLYTASCDPEAQATQIARTWDLHGRMESLKGRYLHKKIELFINA